MPPVSCSHRHHVLFYQSEAFARETVSQQLGMALRLGAPALLIARPAMLAHVRIDLHRQHVQGVPFGPRRGTLHAWDADATLDRICRDGKPDAQLFEQVVGTALAGLARGGARPLAYGEMVDILCARGQYADAVELERLWNQLLAHFDAALCCGYAGSLLETPEAAPFVEAIRAAHGQAHHQASGPMPAWA